MEFELRFVPTTLDTSGDTLKVEGLVNQTDSWSHVLGVKKKFREKISKGAFIKALATENRIDFLAEHDSTKILSTTENGSLELWEDDEGLKMRAEICPTTYGTDTYELMKSKIINHMSFGFKAISDKWKKLSNGTFERTIEELQLLEVSVVRNPAYPQSAIAARGIDIVEDVEIPDDVEIEINEERNCNMNKEQRAYATYLYGRTDVVNSAMNLVAECSSLSGYLMQYVGQDKDTASVLVSLQNTITMANKIINDEIQVLVDDFNSVDAAIKAEAEAQAQIETVDETISAEGRNKDEVIENSEVTEENKEVVETNNQTVEQTEVIEKDETVQTITEEKTDETVEKDENRSFDLSSYKNRLKNQI